MSQHAVLMDVVLALALGALVGTERERQPERKYAGVRTLSLLCGIGPLAVFAGTETTSVAPVLVYLALVAAFSLLIIYIRLQVQEDVGFTTSTTVFLMGVVGVLVGYGHQFEAVATTLIAVFLLSEKKMLHKYTRGLKAKEISDAVKLGILAFVLYPVLPQGAVDPYNVLFLRKALLFVIFILLIQFAAFMALKWFRHRLSFLAAAAVGGVASSLATVSTVAQFARDRDIGDAASSAGVAAATTMILKNGFLFVVLSTGTPVLDHIVAPFLAAAGIGAAYMLRYHRRGDKIDDADFASESPFSFTAAFKFGVLFLTVLMVSELAKTYLSVSGAYGTAFIGGIGSSTAVVASAATMLASASVTPQQASIMVALGITSSLLAKLVYTAAGNARTLTRRLAVPYLLMAAVVLAVAL